jgi:hypothetical protein
LAARCATGVWWVVNAAAMGAAAIEQRAAATASFGMRDRVMIGLLLVGSPLGASE